MASNTGGAIVSVNPDANFWDDYVLDGANPKQGQAITAEVGTIPVSAGAGTGKTWVLARRFARLLLTDPDRVLLPRDILTLTFTDDAANEMKNRIKSQVEELLATAKSNAGTTQMTEEREKVIADFSDSWISTIHSFAKRLLGESGLSLDVDPHAEVISDEQSENFWNDVDAAVELGSMAALARTWNYRLLDEAKSLDADPVLTAAVNCWGADDLSRLARNTVELHASNGHTWRDMRAWALVALLGTDDTLLTTARNDAIEVLHSEWQHVWEQWQRIFNDLGADIETATSTKSGASLGKFYSDWRAYLQSVPNTDQLRDFYLEVTNKDILKGPRGKLADAIKPYLNNLTVAKWQDAQSAKAIKASSVVTTDEPLPEKERQMRSALLSFCALCWGLWDSMKHKRGMMTFADMISNARRALEHDSVDRKFRHILVDEFQDTDHVQFDMIKLAAKASVTYDREGNAHKCSLFAVGDPKQSIYGFRHARPELFANMLAEYTSTGANAISLDVSFRTRSALLERFNQLFSFIWPNGSGIGSSKAMRAVPFESLKPKELDEKTNERDKGTVPPFSLILSAKDESNNIKIADARKQLARALARQCREWVEGTKTVWSKKESKLRPLEYGDITVLVRKRTVYELLEDAFKAEGIDTEEDSSRTFFKRTEIGDVVSLLRAAANPDDDTALAAWLLSPLSGRGIDEKSALECLKQLATTDADTPDGTESIDDAVILDTDIPLDEVGLKASARRQSGRLIQVLEERLPDVANRIRRLSFIGQQGGSAKLLEELAQDRRWLEGFKDDKTRLRVLRNVQRALRLAREFQQGDSSSLTACADWMERAWNKEKQMEEAVTASDKEIEGGNAVHFKTIHGAKGLEFPVVVIFDAMPRSTRGESLCPSQSLGVAFSKLPNEMLSDEIAILPDDEKPHAQHIALENILNEQRERDEDMWLFYVAATRARDSLLLCGLVNRKNDGSMNVLVNYWTTCVIDWLKDRGECEANLTGQNITHVSPDENFSRNTQTAEVVSDSDSGDSRETVQLVRPNSSGVTLESMSATSFSLFEWCPLAWRRRYRQGLNLTWRLPPDCDVGDDESKTSDLDLDEARALTVSEDDEGFDTGIRGGANLGSLVHWLLALYKVRDDTQNAFTAITAFTERWLAEDASEQVLMDNRRRLPPYLRDVYQNDKNRAALREWLRIFAKSDAGTMFHNSLLSGGLQESRFGINIGGTVISGAMDVVWRENLSNSWNVLDYKITSLARTPKDLYNSQLDFYALAVRDGASLRNIPCSAVDVRLVFLREHSHIEQRRIDNWEDIRERILSAARKAGQGIYSPRREHCSSCPWKLTCNGEYYSFN